MGIRFNCPNGHKLNVKAFQAGQKGICPVCGAKMQIPLESTRPSSREERRGVRAAERRPRRPRRRRTIARDRARRAACGPHWRPGRRDADRPPRGRRGRRRPIRWPRRGRGTSARPPAGNLARPRPRSCASGWPKGASPPTRSSGATAGATGRMPDRVFPQLVADRERSTRPKAGRAKSSAAPENPSGRRARSRRAAAETPAACRGRSFVVVRLDLIWELWLFLAMWGHR